MTCGDIRSCGDIPACPLTRTDHRRNAARARHLRVFSGRRFLADRPGTGPGASSAEDHMRTTRVLAASAAAVALVGVAAPTAAAWDQPSSVTAAPNVIARGGQLVLTVRGGDACAIAGSTIGSNAFPTTNLASMGGTTATARVRVNSDSRPRLVQRHHQLRGQAQDVHRRLHRHRRCPRRSRRQQLHRGHADRHRDRRRTGDGRGRRRRCVLDAPPRREQDLSPRTEGSESESRGLGPSTIRVRERDPSPSTIRVRERDPARSFGARIVRGTALRPGTRTGSGAKG